MFRITWAVPFSDCGLSHLLRIAVWLGGPGGGADSPMITARGRLPAELCEQGAVNLEMGPKAVPGGLCPPEQRITGWEERRTGASNLWPACPAERLHPGKHWEIQPPWNRALGLTCSLGHFCFFFSCFISYDFSLGVHVSHITFRFLVRSRHMHITHPNALLHLLWSRAVPFLVWRW